MRTTFVLTMSAIILLGGATGAPGRVLGGGKASSDCYLTFENIDSLDGKTVQCADGSACDADATANGVCTFAIGVCLHQEDVPGCVSPVPSVVKIHNVNGGRELTRAARSLVPAATPVCAAPTNVIVRLKKHKTRPGARTVRMAAIAAGRPARDSDHFRLLCLPAGTSTAAAGD